MTTAPGTQFDIEMTRHAVRRSTAQRIGTLLWAPALVMAVAAFFIAILLAMARAAIIGSGDDPQAAAALGHLSPAFMFIGFVGVLGSVSFVIARILGVLRVGGSEVQETAGRFVHTIRTPLAAKVFVVVMFMGTMIILLGVVANFSTGLAILGGDAEALAQSEISALWIEGIRRIGTAVYLVAIAFGLAAIIEVIRFQTLRLRQLPSEPTRGNSPQED